MKAAVLATVPSLWSGKEATNVPSVETCTDTVKRVPTGARRLEGREKATIAQRAPKNCKPLWLFFSAIVCTYCIRAAEPPAEVFTPLFNGRDLTGWVPVNVAPGTFTVRDGMIVSTGLPTGIMRTDRQYENFIMEVEYRHMRPKGNAGIFVWSEPSTAPGQPFSKSIEVQVLDVAAGNAAGTATGHGDVFAIHGARMTPDRPHPGGWERSLPSEHRAKPAGEWNHYRIEGRDGRLTLAVNGKVVSGGTNCTPRKGYICLESEGSECHFRNLKIRELPSSNPPRAQIASTARPQESLYTGIDLSGWKTDEQTRAHWHVKDWTLECDGKAATSLVSEREWSDVELQLDWRLLDRAAIASLFLRGSDGIKIPLTTDSKPLGPSNWNRSIVRVRNGSLTVIHNGAEPRTQPLAPGLAARGPAALAVTGGTVQFASIYVRPVAD